jgi:hypothetical protein
MKTLFNSLKKMSIYPATIFSVVLAIFFSSCGDDPVKEDVPELITKASLTFTPTGGGAAIVATATDPDGEGVQNITTDGPIILQKGTAYTLTISLINELADISSPEYDITNEVEEEGAEHMFFFSWTNNLFASPSGNGNFDNRADEMGYEDLDDNGNPIGLTTSWLTISSTGTGSFRVVLKHQPDLKSNTSTSADGETDLDVTFDLEIQ